MGASQFGFHMTDLKNGYNFVFLRSVKHSAFYSNMKYFQTTFVLYNVKLFIILSSLFCVTYYFDNPRMEHMFYMSPFGNM